MRSSTSLGLVNTPSGEPRLEDEWCPPERHLTLNGRGGLQWAEASLATAESTPAAVDAVEMRQT